ncbi:MAG: diguanylate cyclase domain-containing protein [Jatrophihabitantaceae bacterium]
MVTAWSRLSAERLRALSGRERLATALLAWAAVNVLLAIPGVFRGPSSGAWRAAAVASALVLLAAWFAGARRGGFPWAFAIVEGALFVVLGSQFTEPTELLGPLYGAVLLRSIYGSARRVVLQLACYVAALEIVAARHASLLPAGGVLGLWTWAIPGLLVACVTVRVLAFTLRRGEQRALRDQALAAAGRDLLRVQSTAQIQLIAESVCAAILGPTARAELTVRSRTASRENRLVLPLRPANDHQLALVVDTAGPVPGAVRDALDTAAAMLVLAWDGAASHAVLTHRATHDPLTRLANRTLLLEALDAAYAAARPVALVYLDLDGFKAINDRYGHGTGDEVLAAVGERLARRVRADDLVTRLGGDEMAILLAGVDDPGSCAARVAGLHDALNQRVSVTGASLHVSASVGWALSRDCDTPSTLLRRADTAMYEAKGRASAPRVRPPRRLEGV